MAESMELMVDQMAIAESDEDTEEESTQMEMDVEEEVKKVEVLVAFEYKGQRMGAAFKLKTSTLNEVYSQAGGMFGLQLDMFLLTMRGEDGGRRVLIPKNGESLIQFGLIASVDNLIYVNLSSEKLSDTVPVADSGINEWKHANIMLIGELGDGTALAKRMATGGYFQDRNRRFGFLESTCIINTTTLGPIHVTFVQPSHLNTDETGICQVLQNLDYGLIMFDVRSAVTLKDVPYLFRGLARTAVDRPLMLVGNRADTGGVRDRIKRCVGHYQIKYGINPTTFISTETGEGIDLLMKKCLRDIFNDQQLDLRSWTTGPITTNEEMFTCPDFKRTQQDGDGDS